MAAPTPGNMENCDPKCKCPGGPYADQAFLCDDPCAGQGSGCSFNCQDGCNCGDGYYRMTVTLYNSGYTYQKCNDGSVTNRPGYSETFVFNQYGTQVYVECINFNWYEFPGLPGCWVSDDASEFLLAKGLDANPPEDPDNISYVGSLVDLEGQGAFSSTPFDACDYYYYVVDSAEEINPP